jgi:hypothetical protein
VAKLKRLRFGGHAAHIGAIRVAYRVLVKKREG